MDVAQLAWLTGQWSGTTASDPVDEHWSTPAGGVLMGMFRWLKADALYLYEFLTIEPEGDSLLLRIKHFGRGGIGWEEKEESTEFVLESLTHHEARFLYRHPSNTFRRLIYRRPDANTLVVLLELDAAAERVIEFHYQSMR